MYCPNNTNVEDICFKMSHIHQVLDEIMKNIPDYFLQYLDTRNGVTVTDNDILKLAHKFGSTSTPKSKPRQYGKILDDILKKAIEDFESDRKDYLDIFNKEALQEHSSDKNAFKNTYLRNKVPIIRKTLNNNTKKLDKYRGDF